MRSHLRIGALLLALLLLADWVCWGMASDTGSPASSRQPSTPIGCERFHASTVARFLGAAEAQVHAEVGTERSAALTRAGGISCAWALDAESDGGYAPYLRVDVLADAGAEFAQYVAPSLPWTVLDTVNEGSSVSCVDGSVFEGGLRYCTLSFLVFNSYWVQVSTADLGPARAGDPSQLGIELGQLLTLAAPSSAAQHSESSGGATPFGMGLDCAAIDREGLLGVALATYQKVHLVDDDGPALDGFEKLLQQRTGLFDCQWKGGLFFGPDGIQVRVVPGAKPRWDVVVADDKWANAEPVAVEGASRAVLNRAEKSCDVLAEVGDSLIVVHVDHYVEPEYRAIDEDACEMAETVALLVATTER